MTIEELKAEWESCFAFPEKVTSGAQLSFMVDEKRYQRDLFARTYMDKLLAVAEAANSSQQSKAFNGICDEEVLVEKALDSLLGENPE